MFVNAAIRPVAGLLTFLVAPFWLTACNGLLVVKPLDTPAPTATIDTLSAPAETVMTGTQTVDGRLPAPAAPGRIVAPAINLDAPVVVMDWRAEMQSEQSDSVWNVPENEAGWHLNSARPGQGGNVVISGHNNSVGGHVFGRLDELVEGDTVTLWANQTAYTYRISRRETVRTFGATPEMLTRLQQFAAPASTEQLTLITCWPNWTNTHRLILVAEPGEL
jgi:sortase A